MKSSSIWRGSVEPPLDHSRGKRRTVASHQATHLPSRARQKAKNFSVSSESRMRDILRGKARNYDSQKLLRAVRPPCFLTGGTKHGSATKRDSSFSREKRVHRLRLGSTLTRKWDLGDAGSVAVYAPCLHSYLCAASAQISLL